MAVPDKTNIREAIEQELPSILEKNSEIRRLIVRISENRFADRYESESRFDRILEEIRQDREESRKKSEEYDKKFYEIVADIRNIVADIRNVDNKVDRKYDSAIGALGSRWGIATEASFRNALKGILESQFDIQVLNVTEFDHDGMVFPGRPDQVEFDIIINNGQLIICEIKSSMSKSEMLTFYRKTEFYEKHHHRKPDVMIVISPMIDPHAKAVAKELGIKLYSYADDVEL